MKFAYLGYRGWAEEILRSLEKSRFEIDAFTTDKTEYLGKDFRGKMIPLAENQGLSLDESSDYDALLFYGWSWMVPQEVVDSLPCVCLHPSPLPLYRGGSPTQNQIIAGEDTSAVTLFRMGKGLDDGPIYAQEEFSLSGSLGDVFGRVSEVGARLTNRLLGDFENGSVVETPQDESRATTYKRRKARQSEITPESLAEMSARQIHDHIRTLDDPYPNAYIVGNDGKKVYITHSKLEDS